MASSNSSKVNSAKGKQRVKRLEPNEDQHPEERRAGQDVYRDLTEFSASFKPMKGRVKHLSKMSEIKKPYDLNNVECQSHSSVHFLQSQTGNPSNGNEIDRNRVGTLDCATPLKQTSGNSYYEDGIDLSFDGNSNNKIPNTVGEGAMSDVNVQVPLRKRTPRCGTCHLKVNTSKPVQNEISTAESSPGIAASDDIQARFSSARESLSELMRRYSGDSRNITRNRPAASYKEMMRQRHEMVSQDDHYFWPEDALDVNTDLPLPPPALLNVDDLDDIIDIFLHQGQMQETDADREQREQTPPYPIGELRYTMCQICLEHKVLNVRFCCHYPACDDCVSQYCSVQVQQAVVKISCIGLDCQEYMHREEISARLAGSMKEKFYKFLIEANKDPNTKTCPQCSHITTYEPQILKNPKVKKKGLRVICSECSLEWCFLCHAPFHEGQTCKDFRKGDKLLRTWAKEKHYGQANARKCPRCKVYIQRTTGCDHMQCSRCKTSFCYRCGDRYWHLKFVGDHYSRFSILGCKYRFMPHKPFQRKLIRGSIFGGKLVVAPVVAGLALVVGAPLLGVGLIALMVYGGYRAHKAVKKRRFIKKHRARIEMIRQRGKALKAEELEISYPMTNTDNLEEIEASRLEHSKSDSVNLGTPELSDSSSFESEAGISQFTQIKVIAEQIKENGGRLGNGASFRNSEGEIICDCGFCDDTSQMGDGLSGPNSGEDQLTEDRQEVVTPGGSDEKTCACCCSEHGEVKTPTSSSIETEVW